MTTEYSGKWTAPTLRTRFKQVSPDILRMRLRWLLDWTEAAQRFSAGVGDEATFGVIYRNGKRAFTIYESGNFRMFFDYGHTQDEALRLKLFHDFQSLGMIKPEITFESFGESRNSPRWLADLSIDEMEELMDLIMHACG